MRYSGIQRCEYVNGNNIGVSLYIQGCSLHCPGCFNPETWDFNGGKLFNVNTTKQLFSLLDKPYISRFSVLGGEPLEPCNWEELNILLTSIRQNFPKLQIWLYTGYEYDFLQEIINDKSNFDSRKKILQAILQKVNFLVAGPFIKELKNRTLAFKGSSNQEIIEINKWGA